MNVKRFRASTMSEALTQVRKALGADAVILRTRTTRKGGLLSFLSKEMIEVVAASPDRRGPKPAVSDSSVRLKRAIDNRPAEEVIRDLKDDIYELKGHVRDLSQQVKYERMPSLPQALAVRYLALVRAGVGETTVKEMTQQLNLKFTGDDLEDQSLVDRSLTEMLKACLRVENPILERKGRPRVYAFVGPTGVGKTTTLAKLVTSYRYWGRQKTALISADTYRVAAIEQLKTFAAIAGLPLEAVYRPEAMKNALSRHTQRDALFIDTAGRSQTDAERLEELEAFLAAAEPDGVFLCLSVTTRLEDQMDVVKRYSRLKPTALIFTKLDESRGPGAMVDVSRESGLPIAFLTCGQGVPDDIVRADPVRLAEILLNPARLQELQYNHFQSWIDAENSRLKQGAKIGG